MTTTYCGFVAIVGRPNVGKSTLFNKLVGHKVSIISSKPQTTRHRIIGINTEGPYQAIYVDTPGLHRKENRALNRLMNRVASSSIYNVELIIFVVEETNWKQDDEIFLNKLGKVQCPVILAINKVDNVTDKKKILPYIKLLSNRKNFLEILPICAENGMNVAKLAVIVRNELPEARHFFPKNYITDRSQKFIISEIIREKLIFFLDKELPYSVTVEIININKSCGYEINCLILTECNGQKKIIIGNNGSMIKNIGIAARKEIEKILENKVYLSLWVKVKLGWSDNRFDLCRLGYVDDI